MKLSDEELRDFLEAKFDKYCNPSFLDEDPLQIPHDYTVRQDVEIAALISAVFAWGQRKTIINKAKDFLRRMDHAPYDFIRNALNSDLEVMNSFVHRTFNEADAKGLLKALQKIYQQTDSLESVFVVPEDETNLKSGISNFSNILVQSGLPLRTQKHFSNPENGSAAKRLNMFLRWMVRRDGRGVDLGIWTKIPMSQLSCPLDVHSGRVARTAGLLNRLQNDWKAVEELDAQLRRLNSEDPVRYDFALFGLGVYEGFGK